MSPFFIKRSNSLWQFSSDCIVGWFRRRCGAGHDLVDKASIVFMQSLVVDLQVMVKSFIMLQPPKCRGWEQQEFHAAVS